MCRRADSVPFLVLQAKKSSDVHLFRYMVVKTFLISGTPLNRLKWFRPLMEQLAGDKNLTDCSHMATYIPHVEKHEVEILKNEIGGKFLGISFDGTSRVGEAINLVGRFCNSDFNLQYRLLQFKTAQHHLNGAQFASLITRVLCTDLGVQPEMLVCMSRDSVLVNGAACRILSTSPFHAAENQLCISHTLNNVGSRMKFDVLTEFMTPWLELVGGRNPHRGAQVLWREAVAPQAVPGYSKTRWHSVGEIQIVLAENFEKLLPFVAQLNARGWGDATRKKLTELLADRSKREVLRLQLAAVRDMQVLDTPLYASACVAMLPCVLIFPYACLLRRCLSRLLTSLKGMDWSCSSCTTALRPSDILDRCAATAVQSSPMLMLCSDTASPSARA